MPLIKAGNLAEDLWVHRADDEALPDGEPAIISLDRWKKDRETLMTRNAPIGLRLKPSEAPGQVAADLDRFGVIALEFPVFKDGRAFSYAKLLRDRHQYKGEVRAFGNIIRDQYLFLDRLGVDAIEVQDTRQLDEWKTAMGEYSVFYQPAADARRPAMALRRQIAEALKPSRPDFDDLTPIGPPRAVRVEVDIQGAELLLAQRKAVLLAAEKKKLQMETLMEKDLQRVRAYQQKREQQAMDAAGAEFDDAKRAALYGKVFDLSNSESYIFPFTSIPTVYATTKDIELVPDRYAMGDIWATSYTYKK